MKIEKPYSYFLSLIHSSSSLFFHHIIFPFIKNFFTHELITFSSQIDQLKYKLSFSGRRYRCWCTTVRNDLSSNTQ